MKYSIRKQLIVIFMSVLTGAILLCLFINSIFLKEYYSMKQQDNLRNAYYQISRSSSDINRMSDKLVYEVINKICNEYNVTALIIDSSLNLVVTFANEEETKLLREQLINKILVKSIEPENFIEQTKDYSMEITTDSRTQARYLEMWGFLENGYLCLIRSSIEDIDESASDANRFLIYVGVFTILVGSVIIFFVSKKLTEPITELTKISAKMTLLDFDAKYQVKGQNEIAQLGQHMNEMSKTLEGTISELKSANHQLKMDIAKKEEIDIMRREFVSNVSHELKTPISIIQGYAEGLLDGIHDDKESKDYYCEVIVDEAFKMNRVVSKLLTLNQLEFGKGNIKLERINICDLLYNAIQGMDILIKQKNIQINIVSEKAVYVWADEFQIEEVFVNYLSNAIHHVNVTRKIDVKLEKTQKGKIRVSVFNSGDPIPEEAVPYLWDKFYKVDKARTREYGGSGIGLSIVKAIMESLDQDYGVINYPDGVAFWFEVEEI